MFPPSNWFSPDASSIGFTPMEGAELLADFVEKSPALRHLDRPETNGLLGNQWLEDEVGTAHFEGPC